MCLHIRLLFPTKVSFCAHPIKDVVSKLTAATTRHIVTLTRGPSEVIYSRSITVKLAINETRQCYYVPFPFVVHNTKTSSIVSACLSPTSKSVFSSQTIFMDSSCSVESIIKYIYEISHLLFLHEL